MFYLFRKTFLTKFWRITYSQFGEDCVLQVLFPKAMKEGFFVDVGCYHPKKLSNTYALYKRGWRGINIDLDREKIAAFDLARRGDINIAAAVSDREEEKTVYTDRRYSVGATIDDTLGRQESFSAQGKMKTSTLNMIIGATKYSGKRIDLLSVDVEGMDVRVLKGLDFETYRPEIVLVESHLGTADQILGSELHEFMTGKQYALVNWVGPTLFYAPASASSRAGAPPA